MSNRLADDHTAIQILIDNFESKLVLPCNDRKEPSMEYEDLRRRVRRNIEELWNYITSVLNKNKAMVSLDTSKLHIEMKDVLELGAEHKRSLISNIDRMRMVDGYEQWRNDEAKSLSDLVRRRLHYLQNPTDCKKARQLICNVPSYVCGYSCALHHINYCFILAYRTERTLILNSSVRIYPQFKWEDLFQPVSGTCHYIEPGPIAENWPGHHDTRVLNYHINILSITWNGEHPPLSIPADLAPRLMRLNGDPGAWWVGQFLKYLLRPRKATRKMLETRMKKLGFEKPIVGVHIRRTDKIPSEANFHSIEEYMTHVEDYFLKLEMNGKTIKRRIFLASDDPSVIIETGKKYPSYELIGDPGMARMAAMNRRYSYESLKGVISDIHLLSLCDFLVCTFSSNMCRTAYEIMHTIYPDASNRVKSLDNIYFYTPYTPHNSEAVMSHHPRYHDETDFMPGDQIDIDVDFQSNHWDGYSRGRNTRTNHTGLLPLFKVKDKLVTEKLPTYANVN